MKAKIYKIVCFFVGHKRINNKCFRCGLDLTGRFQIPPVKNPLPPPD